MSLQDRPLVSVIIPTLNAGDGLSPLLRAVQAQQVPGRVEIIVIDSGSYDSTRDVARRAGARVLGIPRRAFNHGQTRNQAIGESSGEFIALTVQDAEPSDSQWLAQLLAPFEERTLVAGTYGLQVARATSNLLARTRSALWSERHSRPEERSVENVQDFLERSPKQRLELIRFDNVTSCLRRSVWEQVPLPTSNYGEDMAWAKQVLLAGYKVAYVPTAKVWHAHERGPTHQFRRAFVDGQKRVDLVQWPSPRLTAGDVEAILRRMTFFLTTRKFDSLRKKAEIQWFLSAESTEYGALGRTIAIQVYLEVLAFAGVLTEKAFELAGRNELPNGVWIDLFRFATVAVAGQTLGAAASGAQERPALVSKWVWQIASRWLGRGI